MAGGDYIADLGSNTAPNHLRGVMMFDGVGSDSTAFAAAIANLKAMKLAPPSDQYGFVGPIG
jgi:hypothetical protein